MFSIIQPSKVVHIGHSFGSILFYELAFAYPNITDGLILQGFSIDASFMAQTFAAFDVQSASVNQPSRFGDVTATQSLGDAACSVLASEIEGNIPGFASAVGNLPASVYSTGQNLPAGYLTWSNKGANQFSFLAPPYFDPAILGYAETTK